MMSRPEVLPQIDRPPLFLSLPNRRPDMQNMRVLGVCLWSWHVYPSFPCTCSKWTPCPVAGPPPEGIVAECSDLPTYVTPPPSFPNGILNGTPIDKANETGAAPN